MQNAQEVLENEKQWQTDAMGFFQIASRTHLFLRSGNPLLLPLVVTQLVPNNLGKLA